VSQKVDKRAVIRNRIKRSLLGAIERTLAASSDKAADVVVVVRRVTLQNLKSARELLSEFLKKVLSKGYGRGYSR
jgi:ribonuclease P protein component